MLTVMRIARSTLLCVGGAWAALCRLVGAIPLGAEVLGGPWLVVAELGVLCAVVALVAAVVPAGGARVAGLSARVSGKRAV
ncbi:hypothetical protein ABH930_003408 [Kitasatospora sp. GAS204A]|uniref:hypothetical protein n=1 Tax=unclassified Kitasatospora TaxID=2633591 RepID=UPI002473110A|nr:hypothetical protein [Kitasatospora sp. GAS204B]MDH6118169.1 hypothetical protein [Kitasatospora sp. GAS204B]